MPYAGEKKPLISKKGEAKAQDELELSFRKERRGSVEVDMMSDGGFETGIANDAAQEGAAPSFVEGVKQTGEELAKVTKAQEEKKPTDDGYSTLVVILTVVGYLACDVGKYLLEPLALEPTTINKSFFILLIASINVFVSFICTLIWGGNDGGVKALFNKETLLNFSVPTIFFTLSAMLAFLQNSYLDGTSRKVFTNLRIPITALLGRFVMGNAYTGLQWCLMALIVMACLLQCSARSEDGKIFGEDASKLTVGLMFSVIASVFACMGSLLSEKFTKKYRSTPFFMQKFQIELWQIIFAGIAMFTVDPMFNCLGDVMEGKKWDYVSKLPFFTMRCQHDVYKPTAFSSIDYSYPAHVMGSTMPGALSEDEEKVVLTNKFDLLQYESVRDDRVLDDMALLKKLDPAYVKAGEKKKTDQTWKYAKALTDLEKIAHTLATRNTHAIKTEATKKFGDRTSNSVANLAKSLATQFEKERKFYAAHAFEAAPMKAGQTTKAVRSSFVLVFGKPEAREGAPKDAEKKLRVAKFFERVSPYDRAFSFKVSAEEPKKEEEKVYKAYYTNKKKEEEEDDSKAYFTHYTADQPEKDFDWAAPDEEVNIEKPKSPFKKEKLTIAHEFHKSAAYKQADHSVTFTYTVKEKFIGYDLQKAQAKARKELWDEDKKKAKKGKEEALKALEKTFYTNPKKATATIKCEQVPAEKTEKTTIDFGDQETLVARKTMYKCAVEDKTGASTEEFLKLATDQGFSTHHEEFDGQLLSFWTYPGAQAMGTSAHGGIVCNEEMCGISKDEFNDNFANTTYMGLNKPQGMGMKASEQKAQDDKKESKWKENPFSYAEVHGYTRSPLPTTHFGFMVFMCIFANMGQSWFSGLIAKVLSSLWKTICSAVATALVALVQKMAFEAPQKRNYQNGAKWMEFIVAIFSVILLAYAFSLAPKAPKPAKKEEKKDDDKKSDDKCANRDVKDAIADADAVETGKALETKKAKK